MTNRSALPGRVHVVCAFLLASLLSFPFAARADIVVGVVEDGPYDRLLFQQQVYIDELLALTEREFDVSIKKFTGAWTPESMNAALAAAYEDPDVDMVLVTGFVTNQFAATRTVFPKPTFLPVIVDTGLLPSASVDGTSGIPNLNYLGAYADFGADLDTLARITPYRKLVLIYDDTLADAIPRLREAAYAVSQARGVELLEVTHDGEDHALMNRVPGDTDAIFLAGLPRMPEAEFDTLIEGINAAGLPSYSFLGVPDVERGILATNSEPRDLTRQARLNALNMQAVMIGEPAADQPVETTIRDRLTINMATARRIGLSPSFDVLSEAILLNEEAEMSGDALGLVEIARTALEQNQTLRAETFGVFAGEEEIARARANLLPQVSGSVSSTMRRDDSTSVAGGLFSERTNDAAVNVSQLLYSDSARANLAIQREIQQSRMSSLHEFQLEIVLAATTSYYSVLNARSQLRVQENNLTITRANLELAEDRVRLGRSTAADVFRWQSEVAQAQIRVLNARAALNQTWETLNRVLHRPLGTRFALREAGFDEPFVMTRAEFEELVASPADYAVFSNFYVERALNQAPELDQIDAQIAAKRRELRTERRSYWLPDFSISGRYSDNLNQSGVGAGPMAGEGQYDWSIGVQATLPLFSGGLRSANVSRADFELRQLQALRTSQSELIEEEVRRQLYAAQAAYGQIDLSLTAAEASRKNYELVSDAYARGTVTVIDLLDAQDASLTASAAAAESLYGFLITIMAVQRAVGGYDYLLSPEEREGLAVEMRARLAGELR